jgi:hypothetical protein
MTHRLRQRHPLSAIGANPLIATLRYRCECATNEVLQISAVIDMNGPEDKFLWTMKQLWRDLRFEVDQHINPPQPLPVKTPS